MASSLFARRYWGNRCFFLLLRVLRCFSSPGALLRAYFIQPVVTGHYPRRVSPFGYSWIDACLRLPMTFRSLPRPSSAISALAFTLCSYMLDLLRTRCPSFRFRFLLRFPVRFRSSFEPLRSRSDCVCRHAFSPYSLFSISLALLSLCSFQDAHKDRGAFQPRDSSKRYSLREFEQLILCGRFRFRLDVCASFFLSFAFTSLALCSFKRST